MTPWKLGRALTHAHVVAVGAGSELGAYALNHEILAYRFQLVAAPGIVFFLHPAPFDMSVGEQAQYS